MIVSDLAVCCVGGWVWSVEGCALGGESSATLVLLLPIRHRTMHRGTGPRPQMLDRYTYTSASPVPLRYCLRENVHRVGCWLSVAVRCPVTVHR